MGSSPIPLNIWVPHQRRGKGQERQTQQEAKERHRYKRKKRPSFAQRSAKELERLNPFDEGFGSDEDQEEVYGRDLYEYEEELPEEESKKNRRYDPVENLEYKMPEEFEDENVSSDDDNDTRNAGEDEVEDEEDDDGRQRTTRITSEAFEGKKKKKNNVVISEAYPESEYNPTRDMLEGEELLALETFWTLSMEYLVIANLEREYIIWKRNLFLLLLRFQRQIKRNWRGKQPMKNQRKSCRSGSQSLRGTGRRLPYILTMIWIWGFQLWEQ
ncbi:hypothetical protein Pyn_33969 [Prunus yedoensis var. nudiflora]|uniref:Uncharacterized protein n=1 Tax=Prunus yedoensis var. nudiflora TaxID=2094558 RepID=A0A314YFX6_PRUYE|nr:hypothetical protein Pyn_33969 [Prunus yedoensis var. nudiflora]